MTLVSIEPRRGEAGLSACRACCCSEADGSRMSEARQEAAMAAGSLGLNGTAALGLHEQDANSAPSEFKAFNIVVIALALCILAVSGLYCITVCYNRSRQSKRAQVYESAVTRGESPEPVAVKAVKRSTSFMNPLTSFFRRSEAVKDNSRIYYIYSNPLPVGLKEEEEEEEEGRRRRRSKAATAAEEQTKAPSTMPLSFQEYASDPSSGVVLDPPIFYMQL